MAWINLRFSLVSVLICCLHLLWFPSKSAGQNEHIEFPPNHIQPLVFHSDSNFDSFSLLDDVVKDYRFFFTAEEHWQAMNAKIRFRFLTYLHDRGHVRNLIVEAGYSYGYMINRYLETGNENYLVKAIYDIPVCPRDLMGFYRDLYAWNRFLPTREKIKVTGIDLEQSPLLVMECLVDILPQKPLTAGVRDKINQLKSLSKEEYNEKEVRKFFRQFDKEVEERKRAYRRYWGERYWLFEMILKNTVEGFDSPLLREFVYAHGDQKKREERMFDNFRLLQKNHMLREGGYYGQFGAIHTELNPSINWGYNTLANQLNFERYSPVRGKVLTISKYFRRLSRIYEKFPEFDRFMEIMDKIDQTYEEDIILCRLMGTEDIFPEISKDFQFIMLIDERLEAEKCR